MKPKSVPRILIPDMVPRPSGSWPKPSNPAKAIVGAEDSSKIHNASRLLNLLIFVHRLAGCQLANKTVQDLPFPFMLASSL